MFRPLVTVAAVLALLGGCSRQEAPTAAPAPAMPAAAPVAAATPAANTAPVTAPAAEAPAATAPAAADAVVQKAHAAAAVPVAAPQPKGQAIDMFGGNGAPAEPASHNRGKVLQLAEGGGYTYAEVQMASGKKVWIAGSHIDVKQGAEVEWGNYGLMRDFQAKSLNRTFSEILFVDRWAPVGQAPVAVSPHGKFPNGMPAASADEMAAAAAGAAPAAAADPSARGTVKTVTNAGGYSYIEVDQGPGKTVWVAAMETPMKTGDKVQWQGGTQMSNFTARSLGRTFERIIFAQTVSVGK